jgi:hypothetical protein
MALFGTRAWRRDFDAILAEKRAVDPGPHNVTFWQYFWIAFFTAWVLFVVLCVVVFLIVLL